MTPDSMTGQTIEKLSSIIKMNARQRIIITRFLNLQFERALTVNDVLQNNSEFNLARLREERDAWIETSKFHANNEQFYRNILIEIGEMLGPQAYTSDDGTIQDQPLILKIKELIKPLIQTRRSNITWVKTTTAPEVIELTLCQSDSPKPEATSEQKPQSPTSAPNQDTNNK